VTPQGDFVSRFALAMIQREAAFIVWRVAKTVDPSTLLLRLTDMPVFWNVNR